MNIKEIFKEVKQYLEEDKLVCFSGTPCQIVGLKAYLNDDYKNLIGKTRKAKFIIKLIYNINK